MPLQYFPRAGQVLMCDFTGFCEPEMIKPRPIIVISPKLPSRSEIVTVVPVSLTAPKRELPYAVRLSKNYHPQESDDLPCWAKCDMVMNLALRRLDGFKVGRRQWVNPQLTGDDLAAVRRGVIFGLGMCSLLNPPAEPI
jgi:uncharacterized protein YifN (PemK superfamily)